MAQASENPVERSPRLTYLLKKMKGSALETTWRIVKSSELKRLWGPYRRIIGEIDFPLALKLSYYLYWTVLLRSYLPLTSRGRPQCAAKKK